MNSRIVSIGVPAALAALLIVCCVLVSTAHVVTLRDYQIGPFWSRF
jgi:hypothetical protein